MLGVVLDYFWNFLVMFLTLRWLHVSVSTRRKFVYCLIATACGFVIDWLYYQLTWGSLGIGSLRMQPFFPSTMARTHSAGELFTILALMVALGIVNFLISRPMFKLTAKQSLIIGGAMGVFTAPWLIVAFVMLNW